MKHPFLSSLLFYFFAAAVFTTCSTIKTNQPADGCYTYQHLKDTVSLHLQFTQAVNGTLVYNFYGKDKNTGTIIGKMKGDTLMADYTFNSEGLKSIREVMFHWNGTDFREGYGEMINKDNKMIFKDPRSVTFSTQVILKKEDCQP